MRDRGEPDAALPPQAFHSVQHMGSSENQSSTTENKRQEEDSSCHFYIIQIIWIIPGHQRHTNTQQARVRKRAKDMYHVTVEHECPILINPHQHLIRTEVEATYIFIFFFKIWWFYFLLTIDWLYIVNKMSEKLSNVISNNPNLFHSYIIR